jgi:acid phosphatase family membrane protein YuiD
MNAAVWSHQALMAGAIALFSTQALKTLTNMAKERRLNFRVAVGTGGMPSSHTALVVSMTATIALIEGLDSPLFDVCAVFSAIVMYDATGLRQAAGKQAAILNQIVEELSNFHLPKEHRLKELLGHTKLEVIGGALFGLMVALLVQFGW